ncbi:MAG TPA: DNA methyltransferase [Burkholderiales bacterium]|nr:DNA methyltransferase [Burkholderiales bacterium]
MSALVSTKNAAEILGVSSSTINRMIKQGTLLPQKTKGGKNRFPMEDLLNHKQKITNDIDSIDSSNSLDVEQKPMTRKESHPKNKLNDLNGTEWLPETKSYFYQKGLGKSHPHAQIEKLHPAPFSFQDISRLIAFFTKDGQSVLDPFGGVGSTAKACEILSRHCTSIELSPCWHSLSIERLESEVAKDAVSNHKFINGDSRKVLKTFDKCSFDFIITSPPYWSILNKKADHKVKTHRLLDGLSTNYSDNDINDLGNIEEYNDFLNVLVNDVMLECARVLKSQKYLCMIVSDFRNKSEFISFHSDLIQAMNKHLTPDGDILMLQGVKVLIQNHKSLLPYGYPYAYVENIHHQYILIFRKERNIEKKSK